MIRWLLIAVFAFVGFSSDAFAYRSLGVSVAVKQQRPSVDKLVVPAACYSLRRLRSVYKTNKAFNVVRASDAAALDIGFTGNGSLDVGTLQAFLTGTTGAVATWYDQCPTGTNQTQATGGSRPAIMFSCMNAAPCMRTLNSTTPRLASGNITPSASGTLAGVGNRSTGTGQAFLASVGSTASTTFYFNSGNANIGLTTGGVQGFAAIAATTGVWESSIAVINNTATLVRANGFEGTPVTANSTATAGPIQTVIANTSTTMDQVEFIYIDAYVMPAGERASLNNDQIRWVANAR